MRLSDEILWGALGLGVLGVGGYFAYLAWKASFIADTNAGVLVPDNFASTNPFQSDFEGAAQMVDGAASWPSDDALIALVRHESNFKPDAQNPTSTAFGLFQFIKSTWAEYLPEVPHGTVDPYWQAVGGFRYIKKRYGDPARAWAFWQATVKKDVSLAPADLQATAQTWVSKGWAGY